MPLNALESLNGISYELTYVIYIYIYYIIHTSYI